MSCKYLANCERLVTAVSTLQIVTIYTAAAWRGGGLDAVCTLQIVTIYTRKGGGECYKMLYVTCKTLIE